MADDDYYGYSSDSDREYHGFSPIRRRSIYSPPPRGRSFASADNWARSEPHYSPAPRIHRRRRTYDWSSDDSDTFAGRASASRYYPRSRRSLSSIRPRVSRPTSKPARPDSRYTYNWDESDDDYIHEVETTGSLIPEFPLTFHEVESDGLSKTFTIPKFRPEKRPPMTANMVYPEWHQPETTLEDGSVSNLHVVHASEYSLNKDGRQKIRLLCPDRPPPTEPDPSGVQFRWLHLQTQCMRLDTLDKLVINSPYISGDLKAVALNVLNDIKDTTSRKLVGGPHIESGSILRGIGSYNSDVDLQNQPVIFLSSPYLSLSRKSTPENADKEHRTLSLLESLYGYEVESDRQDSVIMKKMRLGSSKDVLRVPQLWCLLVGNDVLITLSELATQDLRKDLIEIDLKTSGLRRPLTIQVLDQYRRPYSVVIDADCNYVDFFRHTIALVQEARTNATDYELLDENNELVSPQRWLIMIKQGSLQDTVFHIVPRFQYQRELRESRSRSRSWLRQPRQQGTSPGGPLEVPRGRRPYVARGFESRTSVNDIPRDLNLSTPLWAAEHRTISPDPRPDYDPNDWALVKYQEKSATKNDPGRKLVTWQDREEGDEIEEAELRKARQGKAYVAHNPEPNSIGNTPLRPNQERSPGQHDPYSAENMQVILRRPTEYTTRASSGVRAATEHRRKSPEYSLSRRTSVPRRRLSSFTDYSFSPRRGLNRVSGPRNQSRSYNRKGRQRSRPNIRFQSNGQRSQSRTKGPDIIVNDMAYTAAKPNILSLGELSDNEQNHRSSLASSATQSDYIESNGSNPMTPDDYDTGDSWSRHGSPSNKRQAQSKGLDRTSKEEDSSERFSIPLPTYSSDSSSRSSVQSEYPKKGTTSISADLVSIRAVIDLGYPFSVQGGMVVLQKALDERRIDELLKLSDKYKTTRADIAGSIHTISEPGKSPSPAISLLPFFHWRVETTNDNSSTNTDVILVQMLVKLDQQLRSDNLYSKTYACTWDGLLHRHANFIDKIMPSTKTTNNRSTEPSVQYIDSKLAQGIDPQLNKPEPIATGSRFPTVRVATSESGNSEATRGERISSVDLETNDEVNIKHGKVEPARLPSLEEVAMESLLLLSQELLGAFLPQEGSAAIHQVSRHFWGSVDEMFRHIIWSAVAGTDRAEWVIRDFTSNSTLPKALSRAPTNKKVFGDCAACNSGKIYASHVEALEHLHSEHLSCANPRRSKQPYDDPCFVWLKHSEDSQAQQNHNEVMTIINGFIDSLANVRDLAMELQYLVATTSHQDNESEFRPFLPSNVFYAFQEILSMYFITSRQLSIINRLGELRTSFEKHQVGSYRRKITSLGHGGEATFIKACELLENSKGDIILSGITTRSHGTLGIESVGPQFLVAALAANTQNRPLLPDTDTDVVQVYHEYTSRLRYQANRRPRRRVFLDIHRLQEDLEALQNIVSTQIEVLESYQKLLSPASYRVTDASRQGFFPIESLYIESQTGMLQDRNEDIHVQRERAKFLKEQVKQTIEILEEGHGKAIRVFTIVTVFFLPLSFITSFFGMNTTDIRDINYDQRLFWTVSIPVTVIVLAFAFLYGYKGDGIEDRILALMHSRNERGHQQLPEKTGTWGTVASVENNLAGSTSGRRLPPWLKPVRRRRKHRNNSGIKRRMTDMTY